MGNQYSDASGGDLVNHGHEGGAAPPGPDGGFQAGNQAVAVPLPVGSGARAGSQMRDSGPIGTPPDDTEPLSFEPLPASSASGPGVLKTGTVHTRTHSFDAGDLSERDRQPRPPHCVARICSP